MDWRALAAHPEVRALCEANPDVTVYAEVYGRVQDLTYGLGKNDLRLAAFDILRGDRWLPTAEARAFGAGLPWTPIVYQGPYDPETIAGLADAPLVDGVLPRDKPHVKIDCPHIPPSPACFASKATTRSCSTSSRTTTSK